MATQDAASGDTRLTCPQCGEPLSANDRYCMRCGAKVSDETQEPAEQQAVAEAAEEGAEGALVEAAEALAEESSVAEGVTQYQPFWEVVMLPLQIGWNELWHRSKYFTGCMTFGIVLSLLSLLPDDRLDVAYWVSAIPLAFCFRYFFLSLGTALKGEMDAGMEQPGNVTFLGFLKALVIVAIILLLWTMTADMYESHVKMINSRMVATLLTVALAGFIAFACLVVVADFCAQSLRKGEGEGPEHVALLTQNHWGGFMAVVGFVVLAVPATIPITIACSVLAARYAKRYGLGMGEVDEKEAPYRKLMREYAEDVYVRFAGEVDLEIELLPSPGRHRIGVLMAAVNGLLFGWVVSWYWLASMVLRLLVHAYRGERLVFWSMG